MSRTPTANIDYTSRDYEAFRELLIQKLQEKMPEYTDTGETDAGIVILEALANGLDILSLYLDVVANDVILPTTQSRRMAVMIAECLGYTPYNQTASIYPQVFKLNTALDSDYIIPKGTVVKTDNQDSDYLPTLYFETLDDLIIPHGDLGDEKDDNDNYIHTVNVMSGQTINQDVIGSSTGSPLQSFVCNYTRVLVDTLQVYVDEGSGSVLWTRVDSFYDADSTSKVYTVSVDDYDVCTIQFGNGVKGKIPSAYANGIRATYMIGGGTASILDENTITLLDSSLPYVASTFNLPAIVKGHDKESLESIKVNAPATFRTKNRLVTLGDYEDLLKINFYGFQDIKALPDDEDIKLVHLFYIMRTDYTYDSDMNDEVVEYIADRSMIGTSFDINEYTAETINFGIKLYVDRDYDAEALKTNVTTYLTEVTFSDDNRAFGRTIIKSDLESELKEMFAGLVSIRINTPSDDIITASEENNVLTLGTITYTVEYV